MADYQLYHHTITTTCISLRLVADGAVPAKKMFLIHLHSLSGFYIQMT